MGYLKNKELIIESRYKVIKKLGSSKYATTYKVKDVRSNNYFALKIYDKLNTDDFYRVFDAESMEKVVSIHYKLITDIYDFGFHNNHIFFIREIFSENSIDKLKFENISLAQFYSLIAQILDIINFLDSQNLKASNIKPSNFLYKSTTKLTIKLTDYFYIGPEKKNEEYDNSFFYRAPESIEENKINIISNLFSLGIILYKMTTGVFPYSFADIKLFNEKKNLKVVKSPAEINSLVSERLANFILKLIKLNPEDRFLSIDDVIKELNRIQGKDFSNITKMSLKQYVHYHDYYVNEDISHQLVDHINKISRHDVDNIVVLYGQKGIRKDRTIALFRYHILNDKNLIFDYKCSEKDNDPFFSLCQEFFNSGLIDKNDWQKAEPEISDRFKEFVNSSGKEIEAKADEEKTLSDFLYVTKFIFFVAKKEKPLIFVIRNAEYLHKITIDYLNYLIAYKEEKRRFSTSPIMIVISTNNVNKMYRLNESSTTFIRSKTLSYEDSKSYIGNLLKNFEPPEREMNKIWYYTHGNPLYMKTIVLDLIRKGYIYEEDDIVIYRNIVNYKVPKLILRYLNERLSNLRKKFYDYLKKISWLRVKFTKEILYAIIPDMDSYFIEVAIENEFLDSLDNYHYKISPGFVNEILIQSLSKEEKTKLSEKFLGYILKHDISYPFDVIKSHIEYVKNYKLKKNILLNYAKKSIENKNFILYIKSLFELFKETYNSQQSYDEIRTFSIKLIINLEYLYESQLLDEIAQYFIDLDKNFLYRNIVIGLCLKKNNKLKDALKQFLYAYKRIKEVEDKFLVQLFAFDVYSEIEDFKDDEKISSIMELDNFNLLKKGMLKKIKSEFYNYYYLRLLKKSGLHYLDKGNDNFTINLVKQAMDKYQPKNHLELFIFMDFFNFLGNAYSNLKQMDKAIENYNKALKIAQDYNIFYKIILIKNNIADSYLVMGNPEAAIPAIRGISTLCSKKVCIKVHIQTLVNLSEAYIKMGDFDFALDSLENALNLSLELDNKPFWENILQNMALIKIKLINFNNYIEFIQENYKDLYNGKLKRLTPTEKTYFYFLNQIGDFETIKKLLKNYKKIFENEQEFYYRVRSFLVIDEIKKGHINSQIEEEANTILNKTIESSRAIKSSYAETISLLNLADYYLLLGNLQKSEETLIKAENNCKKYNYKYWSYQAKLIRILIELQKPNIELRKIIYDLLEINKYFEKNKLYYSEIFSLYILIIIANFMKRKKSSLSYFNKYKARIIYSTTALETKYKKLFEKKFPLDYEKLIENSVIKITERSKKNLEDFIYEIFTLLNNKSETDKYSKLVEIMKDYIYFEHLSLIKITKKFELNEFYTYKPEKDILSDNKLANKITSSLDKDQITLHSDTKFHYCIVPIAIKYDKFGAMILYENIDLPALKKSDFHRLDMIRIHLTSFFKYSEKIDNIVKREANVKKMLEIFNDTIISIDINSLENKILQRISELLDADRGFIFKNGKEITHYTDKIVDEKKQHTNINLSLIEKESNKKQLDYSYFSDTESPEVPDTIFIMNLKLEEFDYQAIYYFDNIEKTKSLQKFDKNFLDMIINLIRTAMAVIQRKLFSLSLKKDIENFREEKIFFLKLLSHEFNTPLTKIQYALEKIKEENNSENVSTLYRSFHRISYLMDMLNKFYYYKEIYQPYISENDIRGIIHKVVNEIKNKSIEAGRKLIFKTEFSGNLPNIIKIDSDAIIDIFKILLSNAVRFSSDGKEIIVGARMALFEKERISKDTLVLYVTDFGKGISKSQSAKIYNLIYEAKDINSHKSGDLDYNSGGLGLGLSIASMILKKLHGTIEHESIENVKTTFFVRIPLD